MDEETKAAVEGLRARCAALEFAIVHDDATARRRAVTWALAFETAAPVHIRPEAMEYVVERLRDRARGAVMWGPRTVEALAATSPADAAKVVLFEAFADPVEARSVVDTIARSSASWATYGLPGEGAAEAAK